MTSGTVHIYDITNLQFTNMKIVNDQSSPGTHFKDPFKVTCIKCQPDKMQRILVSHSHSHVQVYSLNKKQNVQLIKFAGSELLQKGEILSCEFLYSQINNES